MSRPKDRDMDHLVYIWGASTVLTLPTFDTDEFYIGNALPDFIDLVQNVVEDASPTFAQDGALRTVISHLWSVQLSTSINSYAMSHGSLWSSSCASVAHMQPIPVRIQQQSSTKTHRSASQQPAAIPVQHNQVIIQNLPVNATDDKLKQWLNHSVGQVQDCRIKERGDKKRHAFVTFTDEEHAKMAVRNLDKSEWCGREIGVRLTKEGEKGPVIINGSVEG
ncbi:MAG: hypothetical protein Q9218_002507 [Villophora microphyllina]